MEYITFIKDNPNESATAYGDTMGDLTMSLLGSITGGVLVATVLWGVSGAAPPAAGSPVAANRVAPGAAGPRLRPLTALVAQLDRASDYGSEGWGFESLRAR